LTRNVVLILLFALLILCGCATLPRDVDPTAPAKEDVRWWAVRFRFEWDTNAVPDWYFDLLLAHRVIAPILEDQDESISLWRFHRRARDDKFGHQFSFIFWADSATAQMVKMTIDADPVLSQLRQETKLRKIRFGAVQNKKAAAIENTSDRMWSAPLRQAWPYFIMGVSRTWLSLIDYYSLALREPSDLSQPSLWQDHYQHVDVLITDLWQLEGRHAFLHHLNAIFGYQPLVLPGDELMRF
jgi:hypothetical protein